MGRHHPHNGIEIPGMMPVQKTPQFVLSQPFNDAQLISMVAAQVYGAGVIKTVAQAVTDAVDIVAHACVAQHALPGRIKAIGAAVAEAQEKGAARGEA